MGGGGNQIEATPSMAVLRTDEGGGETIEACWSPVVFCCSGSILKTTRKIREEKKRARGRKKYEEGGRGGPGGAQT